MFSFKELREKQLFQRIMPNILRRLSRSLSADRKRKNSCTQLNDENLTIAQNGKLIPIEPPNSTVQNGTRKSRPSKKLKNHADVSSTEKEPEFKERRKFWTRSTSFGKRNQIPLKNTSEENQDNIPPNLTALNPKTEGDNKWFTTNAFQSDATDGSSENCGNKTDAIRDSAIAPDDITPTSNVYCDVCGDLCEGETLKPFEKDVWIHQKCFKCAICKKDLDPCLYFERGHKYLCAKDYHISLEASLGLEDIDTGEATQNGYRSNYVLQKGNFTDDKTQRTQNGCSQSKSLTADSNPVKDAISSDNLTHKDPFISKQRVTVPPVTSTQPGNSPDRIVSKCSQTYPQTVKRQTATMTSVEPNTINKTPNATSSMPSSSRDVMQESEKELYHHHQQRQQEWSNRMGVCHICEQDLDRSGALLVMGRLLHSDCYICCNCGRQPKVGQEVTIQAKKVICCNGLPERIKTCQGCLKQIFHGELTLSVGGGGEKTWHRMCFRCSKCSMLISEEFHFKDNLQHCLRCYKRYCDVTCLYCGQLIVGEGEDSNCITTAGNKRYHPKCAFCSVCGGHFKSAHDMLTEGDELWHPKCSTLRKSIRQMENFITGAQPKTNSSDETSHSLSPRSNINPWMDKAKEANSPPAFERLSPSRELSVSGDIPASELKSHFNLPLVEEETENEVASEEAEKCCTQASFITQDTNKRQITFPTHKTVPLNPLKPMKKSPPTPIPTAQSPFRQPDNNRIQSPFQRDMGFDPNFSAPNSFLSRLNQAKLDQQIYRGRQARPMYSNRRKLQSSRHVSLEPTIVESELENEAIYENEDMFEKESEIREESESDKSSQEDSRSIGSNASSTDFNFTESKATTPKRTTAAIQYNSDNFIPYSQLRVRNTKLPTGIDRKNLEVYLSDSEFFSVFKCSKHEFYKLPKWRRDGLKKQFELF